MILTLPEGVDEMVLFCDGCSMNIKTNEGEVLFDAGEVGETAQTDGDSRA